jgi:hypothetical protein
MPQVFTSGNLLVFMNIYAFLAAVFGSFANWHLRVLVSTLSGVVRVFRSVVCAKAQV